MTTAPCYRSLAPRRLAGRPLVRGRTLALCLVAGLASAASAQSLTTAAPNNGLGSGGGIFMDLTPSGGSLNLNSLDFYSSAATGSPAVVQVYTKSGTYVGFDNVPGAWTLHETISTTSNGTTVTTPLTLVSPLILSGGQITAVYLYGQTGGVRYTGATGAQPNWSNAELSLYSAHARSALFAGTLNTPRVFSGTINYTPSDPNAGACCLPSGACTVVLEAACTGQGGTFNGMGTTCASANCPTRCCFNDGTCQMLSPAACATAGGLSTAGTNCASTCPQPGACCNADQTCTNGVLQAACVSSGGIFQGEGVMCAAVVCPALYAEVEPNENKTSATVINFANPGDVIRGNTTGTSSTAGGGSLDQFLIKTPAMAPGVYRNRLTITTSGAEGHTGTIRGTSQTAAAAGAWPGPVGTAGTSDSTVQTSSATTAPARFNQWYGFGKQEQVYYRVTGGTATTGDYYAAWTVDPVAVTDLGPSFTAGIIDISTIAQGHTTDTDLWVYDANFNAMTGYGNDDESANGGASGSTAQSFLRREFAAGTYYIAITSYNLANNQGSPCDDDFRTGIMLDFPDALTNNVTTTSQTVSFAVTDAAGTRPFAATKDGAFDVAWVKMTVAGAIPTGACCHEDGTCAQVTEANCLATPGGVYGGNGVTCAAANCPQPGACCFADGTCSFVLQSLCTGESWAGANVTCATANCPQPGACCLPSGCIVFSQAQCVAAGGTYTSHGTTCAQANCPPPTVANIVGLNFTTATSTTPDPQNWNRISAAQGTLSGAMDDSGAPTPVNVEYGGDSPTTGFVYLSTSTLAPDATPLYNYDLSGMTGYGFRSGGAPFHVVFSNLTPDTEYQYWVVAYRVTSAIDQTVQVSDGDILNATSFQQVITAAANDGRFLVNETAANNTQHFDTLARTTTSSSTGTLTINWAGNGTQTTVIGAIAVRRVLEAACYANCDGSTQAPVLNVQDFSCFLTRYAAGESYANCDESTQAPVLNVQDFSCFLTKYAAGCP